MKIRTTLIIFGIILTPSISFATSGACSYHGGVDCSLSNAFTSVICSDGWSDSSTDYYSLQECKNVSCDIGAVGAYSANKGMAGSPFGSAAVSNCERQNTSLQNTTYIPRYRPESQQSLDERVAANVKKEMDPVCQKDYGSSHATYDYSLEKCVCTDGYLESDINGTCVDSETLNQQHKDWDALIANIIKKQNASSSSITVSTSSTSTSKIDNNKIQQKKVIKVFVPVISKISTTITTSTNNIIIASTTTTTSSSTIAVTKTLKWYQKLWKLIWRF